MSGEQQYNASLSEQVLFILLSLATDRKHGYAIMKDVEDLSAGKMVLSSSTLYGALGRMQQRGLIVRVEEDEEDDADYPGMPRKYYQLSDLGKVMANPMIGAIILKPFETKIIRKVPRDTSTIRERKIKMGRSM